jgi:hypothetical protein
MNLTEELKTMIKQIMSVTMETLRNPVGTNDKVEIIQKSKELLTTVSENQEQEKLQEALVWLLRNFEDILAKKPVRSVPHSFSFAESLLK